MSLAETIRTGMNNPECAFFVGQTLGVAQSGNLILKVALVYFGFRLLDRIVFTEIPKIYKKMKEKNGQN